MHMNVMERAGGSFSCKMTISVRFCLSCDSLKGILLQL